MPGNSLLLVCLAMAVCGTAIVTAQDDETVVRDTPGDFDGDGMADRGHWKSDGSWELDLAANGFGEMDVRLTGCGDRSMAAEIGDVDKDGKSDLRLRVSATDALVDLAANGFGRWDKHEVATPQASQRVRKLLGEKTVKLLENADRVIPFQLTLPKFDVVEADGSSDTDVPDTESNPSTETEGAPVQSDGSTEDDSTSGATSDARTETVTINGVAASLTGQALNEAERSLLRSLLLSDTSFVFGVQKRRPFVATHAFRLTHRKESVDVVVDTSGAMLMVVHGEHRVTLNCDLALGRLQLLLARIQPDPKPDSSADKESDPCAE
ncbi:MAG: hypothetical protein HQ518_30625 [Rhodopirellula sp.]|nr:hypothetical protein [Rhodopirellula sp.]